MIEQLGKRKFSTRARALAIPAGLGLAGVARFGGVTRAQTPQPSAASLDRQSVIPAETDLVNQVLKDFMAAFPNIKVTFEPISTDYLTKLQTDLAAGNVADVFYLDSLAAPDLMAPGQLLALDSYMAASGVSGSDFFPVCSSRSSTVARRTVCRRTSRRWRWSIPRKPLATRGQRRPNHLG